MNYHNDKLVTYRQYWREAVSMRYRDQAANDPETIVFDDYITLANEYGFHEKLAIAPLWVADDAVAYNGCMGLSPSIDILNDILLPVSLFAYYQPNNTNHNGYRITIPFGKECIDHPVTDDEMCTYSSHYSLNDDLVIYPFKDMVIEQPRHLDLDNLLGVFDWIGGKGNYFSAMDVRTYLYMLSKKIKTGSSSIKVAASTLTRSATMVERYDKYLHAPLSPEMQKALLVTMIMNNPYVRSNILIF